jgi:hypothetical protein
MTIPRPPRIDGYQLSHGVTLRYAVATALTGTVITFQNLLDTILFATTAVAPYDVFSFVKIKKITLWATPALGTTVNVSCVFPGLTGGVSGDEQLHTDNSMGIEPAYLSVKPSARSLASFFQSSSNLGALVLYAPQGAVIDVKLHFRGSTLAAATAAQNASVGAAVGATYWRGLDGIAVAASKFTVPLGIVQI